MASLLQVIFFLSTLTFIEVTSLTTGSAQDFLTNLMNAFDLSKDGTVSDSEIATALMKQDTNNDDKVDKDEFINFVKTCSPILLDKAEILFLLFDNDESGFVDLTDIFHLMKAIDVNNNGIIDDKELEDIVNLFAK